MATTVRDAAALLACWPATASTTPRTPWPAGWPASGSACRGRRTGATARTPTQPPSGRRAARRRGRHDRRRHGPGRRWTTRLGRRAARACWPSCAAGLEALPRHPPRRRSAHAGGRRRVQPRARRRRSCSTSGSRCSSRRWRGRASTSREYAEARARCVRHGATTASTRVLREHDLDALVTPSYPPAMPDRPGQPRGARGLLHARRRRSRATRCSPCPPGWPRACRSPSRSGVRRAARRPWWRSRHGYEQARNRDTGPLPAPTFPPFV